MCFVIRLDEMSASLDRSRIQGFGSDGQEDAEKNNSFWSSTFASFSESVGNVQTAFGSAGERFTEAFTSKEESDEEDAADEVDLASPRQRAEASSLVSSFCSNYPVARVIPKYEEIEAFWLRCSVLQAGAMAGAIYDQLSFSDGENDWRPRLRVLYALHHIQGEGKKGKAITALVWQNASGLIQHLATEVPQCREKAREVSLYLSGELQWQPLPESISSLASDAGAAACYAPAASRYSPAAAAASTAAAPASASTADPLAALEAASAEPVPQPALVTQALATVPSMFSFPPPPGPALQRVHQVVLQPVAPTSATVAVEPVAPPLGAIGDLLDLDLTCRPSTGFPAAAGEIPFNPDALHAGSAAGSSGVAGSTNIATTASTAVVADFHFGDDLPMFTSTTPAVPPTLPSTPAPAVAIAVPTRASTGRGTYLPDEAWQMDSPVRAQTDPFAFVTDLTGIQ